MPTLGNNQQQPVARLIIDELRVSDEALYKCDVTYVRGKCPSISMVRLQMLALPERARIWRIGSNAAGQNDETMTQQQQQQQPLASGQLIGPYNEHEQLQLMCQVSGGRPAPKSVFWRKLDPLGRVINLTPPTQQHSAGAQLNHTLTSSDLGAKFECHVEHEALEMLRPQARIISPTHPPALQQQRDALLDLHPAASNTQQQLAQQEETMAQSLDSHVIIDLNGK